MIVVLSPQQTQLWISSSPPPPPSPSLSVPPVRSSPYLCRGGVATPPKKNTITITTTTTRVITLAHRQPTWRWLWSNFWTSTTTGTWNRCRRRRRHHHPPRRTSTIRCSPISRLRTIRSFWWGMGRIMPRWKGGEWFFAFFGEKFGKEERVAAKHFHLKSFC